MDEMLARLFTVGDNVDAAILLEFDREQRGIVLRGRKLFALQSPLRP